MNRADGERNLWAAQRNLFGCLPGNLNIVGFEDGSRLIPEIDLNLPLGVARIPDQNPARTILHTTPQSLGVEYDGEELTI